MHKKRPGAAGSLALFWADRHISAPAHLADAVCLDLSGIADAG